MKIKIGNGYDVHRLEEGRDLILGGVKIPYKKGLQGHSDADVLIHSIIDSILGALGKGDIGKIFPDSKKEFKDISSIILLEKVCNIMKEEKYNIGNIDATVVAENPKISEYINEMKKKISIALKTEEKNINIKGTTEEKLGFTGNGEGIKSYSVCLLVSKKEQ